MSEARQALGSADDAGAPSAARPGRYVVVARRYRPQTFDELVGQQHVAQALKGAIESRRVGHAYLFTGARGVGKTSAARILAKALDCVNGPTPTPCNRCEMCVSISSGDDVDVLEIDGASNRGIDEMRQLRQNVNVRPSRARYKVYIIDEVHMLTREAFNALLKTLEEPPEHVKFIFCTTEPEKIPVTILSRCQRFDFAGIQTVDIITRLEQIAQAEGVQVDEEALELLARRAAGSMRDSQSLLEQLLAVGQREIAVPDVHRLLGTAVDTRLTHLAGRLIERDAAGALAELDAALAEGVDVGQLLEQLLGYFRDLMVAAVGCTSERFLYTSRSQAEEVAASANRLGVASVLAIMQIVEQVLSRLRWSTHGRLLAELALVRICQLEDLDELSSLVARLAAGESVPSAEAKRAMPSAGAGQPAGEVKKKVAAPAGSGEVARAPHWQQAASGAQAGSGAQASSGAQQVASGAQNVASANEALAEVVTDGDVADARLAAGPPIATASRGSRAGAAHNDDAPLRLSDEESNRRWEKMLADMNDMTSVQASSAAQVAIEPPATLAVTFRARYNSCKKYCERGESKARLERAAAEVFGRPVVLKFLLTEDLPEPEEKPSVQRSSASRQQKLQEKAELPLVRRAMELFDARPVQVEE